MATVTTRTDDVFAERQDLRAHLRAEAEALRNVPDDVTIFAGPVVEMDSTGRVDFHRLKRFRAAKGYEESGARLARVAQSDELTDHHVDRDQQGQGPANRLFRCSRF